MYTQCPECLTIYEIDEDALQASLGIVQCGRCSKRFDALRTLSDTLPLAPLAPLPEQDPATHAPTLTDVVPPAAYDSAARKQRARDAAGQAGTGQHEPAPAPSAPAIPGDGNAPSRASADDWFADLETELRAASAEAPADPALPVDDDDSVWMVELPDETGGEATAAAFQPPVAADDPADAAVPEAWESLDTAAPWPEGGVFDAGTDAPVSDDLADGAIDTAASARVATPAATADDATATAAESAGDDVSDAPAPAAPVYVRPRRHRVAAAGLAWAAGCLLLALALAAQLGWVYRVELIRNPATRAWTESLCRSVPCRLPPIKDVARLELLSRDVRPDPNRAGALTITATVRNSASFRQPWPVVTVELTDIDNHAVAMRRFRPAEYMPDPARRAAGIAPGATAALAFEVADPGKSASGFRFGFE
jgi:predicted Zn finger-like uncharacterized protein